MAVLVTVAVCVGITLTSAAAILSLLIAYPLILGALAGGLAAPQRSEPWRTDDSGR